MKSLNSLAGIRIPTYKTDKMCPIHNIPMVATHLKQLSEPFCEECLKEDLEAKKKKLVSDFKVDHIRGFLNHNSLVDDPDIWNCSFENWNAPKGSKEAGAGNKAYRVAEQYIKDKQSPMTTVLFGSPGEGKTHLAMSILKKVNSESLQKCLFIDINTLFTNIKRSFDDSTVRWNEYYTVNLIAEADLVVLDDLGSESAMMQNNFREASDFKQEILKEILDRQKRLIITTNLSFNQLKQVYNAKLFSRLLSHSEGRRIDFEGIKDKRLYD